MKQIVTEQTRDQVQQCFPLIYPNPPYQEQTIQQPPMNLTPSFVPSDVSVAPSMSNTTVTNITPPTVQHFVYTPRVIQKNYPVQMRTPPGYKYTHANSSTLQVAPPHSSQGFSNFSPSQPWRNRNRNKSQNSAKQMPLQ